MTQNRRPQKVLTVLGTRPEAIKLAPVITELRKRSEDTGLQSVVCVTGQHREMLDQVLSLFRIVPDYDLNLMKNNQSLAGSTADMIARLEGVLDAERPDWVIVEGDTTTVLAASITAFYRGAKVAHVEAGLRTGNKWQPFPEEINRRVAGVIADQHFAPTNKARQNLLAEGVPEGKVLVTGNPVIDALRWAADQPLPCASPNHVVPGLDHLLFEPSHIRLILVTAHRRENFGTPLEEVCLALREIAERYEGLVRIVYPVHLNPRVWDTAQRLLSDVPNVVLTPPLDYLWLVHLMKCSYLVLTDSGGIQEEAPSLGKPVLVLREVTERPEAATAGAVRLVGTSRQRIVSETVRLLEDPQAYDQMARAVNPYGDGYAAERIVKALLEEPVTAFQVAEALTPQA